MTFPDALHTLLEGRDLSRVEARAVMGEVMSGDATPAQIAGVLALPAARGFAWSACVRSVAHAEARSHAVG
jgi:anthranilate phosphoribosyltransferase